MLSHTALTQQTFRHTISAVDAEDLSEDALQRKLIEQRDDVVLMQVTPAV